MSYQEHTTPFFMEDSDYPLPSSKKLSKNSQIYGVFNEESDPSDSEAPHFHLSKPQSFTPETTTIKPSIYPNFKKSEQLLYEPTKKIQVKYAEKAEPPRDDLSDLKEKEQEQIDEKPIKSEIRAKRVFDFKKRKTIAADLSSHDLPEQLGGGQFKRKKVKIEETGRVLNNEAAKLRANYGKGYLMARHLGFELGKGLGKDKQGMINPVEAVRKTAYNTNFENKILEKTENVEMNEEVIEEKSHKIRDETEKVSKRWKVGRRNKTKKKIDVKDLENEWYNVDKKEDIQQKIIDMRGPETVYIENMARGEKKTGVLAEFLLILKVGEKA